MNNREPGRECVICMNEHFVDDNANPSDNVLLEVNNIHGVIKECTCTYLVHPLCIYQWIYNKPTCLMCDSFIMVPPPPPPLLPIHIPTTNTNIPPSPLPPPSYELYRYAQSIREEHIHEPDNEDEYFELHNEDNITQPDCVKIMCIFLIIILIISGWIVSTVT
uniref:Uncharacterized protein n=1 Tax=viral metagenome TaxID=1070528 RepID=A0A6C0BWQ5_9ZZZZ